MYNLRLGKIALICFIGVFALDFLGLASSQAARLPSDAPFLEVSGRFTCPKSEGVCIWSSKLGWRKVLDTPRDAIVEFFSSADGRLVTLVRGHGNPGQTVVLTQAGAVQVIKSNAMEGSLARVAGSDERGNVVLCSDGEDSRCDTLLPIGATYSDPPWFPKGCLFPRFLGTELRACLAASPKPVLLLIRGESDIKKIELPEVLSNPSDFHLLSSSQFLFAAADTLYSLRLGGTLEVVAKGGFLWSKQIEGKVLFGFYEESEGRKRGSVRRFAPGVGVQEIWASTSFIPTMVQPAGRGLLLDVWGGGHRKILYLASEAGTPERVVWSETSSVWK